MDNGIKYLANILSDTNIEILYLGHNNITDNGVKYLVNILSNTNLKYLYLENNNLSQSYKLTFSPSGISKHRLENGLNVSELKSLFSIQ